MADSNTPPDSDSLSDETMRFLSNTSDFALVITATSILDATLARLLNNKLMMESRIPLPKGLADRVFEQSGGPLSTMSNRTVMAFALGLIDRDMLTRLDTFRKIRNEFAHRPALLNFETRDEEIDKHLKVLGWKSQDTTPDSDLDRFSRGQFFNVKIYETSQELLQLDKELRRVLLRAMPTRESP
jgi:DNA-binding MltR family transcriptional regulator